MQGTSDCLIRGAAREDDGGTYAPGVGDDRRGMLYGLGAYVLWGLFPLYWPLVKPAGSLEILAHRVGWSLLALLVIVPATRSWQRLRALVRSRRRTGLLAIGAVLLAVNWGVYIYGVNTGHVVETSLGYFVNPLVTVLLGVVVLRERLRRAQWLALGLGTIAVVVIAIDYGRPPWIALTLAASFGSYGLIKKHVAAGAVESLSIETSVLFLPAVAYLGVLVGQGDSTFGHHGAGQAVLLAGAGLVTTAPLLFFGAAAPRLRLSTLGLLQYVTPILQFGCGILVFHEPLPAAEFLGFGLVWIALIVFTVDSIRQQRSGALTRRREPEYAADVS